jgi:formylmethanofuran dehydrogenase subunit E
MLTLNVEIIVHLGSTSVYQNVQICVNKGKSMSEDEKKYYIVCYMRINPEDVELMTRDQAKVEIEQARLMQPENMYRLENIDDDVDVV